jgi:hypothetical protein
MDYDRTLLDEFADPKSAHEALVQRALRLCRRETWLRGMVRKHPWRERRAARQELAYRLAEAMARSLVESYDDARSLPVSEEQVRAYPWKAARLLQAEKTIEASRGAHEAFDEDEMNRELTAFEAREAEIREALAAAHTNEDGLQLNRALRDCWYEHGRARERWEALRRGRRDFVDAVEVARHLRAELGLEPKEAGS